MADDDPGAKQPEGKPQTYGVKSDGELQMTITNSIIGNFDNAFDLKGKSNVRLTGTTVLGKNESNSSTTAVKVTAANGQELIWDAGHPPAPKPEPPWWKASLLWLLRTTAGKVVSWAVALLLAGSLAWLRSNT